MDLESNLKSKSQNTLFASNTHGKLTKLPNQTYPVLASSAKFCPFPDRFIMPLAV